jgi:polysaccharide pyruvyl transferase WcaK-like protein
MIAVLHAYSRANAGDGLLVDLTIQRLERAGVARSDIVIVALDPASFSELRAVGTGTADRAANGRTALAALSAASMVALRRFAPGDTPRILREADAFVSVGGGYLRAGTRTNTVGTAINHLPQLHLASQSGRPSIYLPQSIGPLRGVVGRAIRRSLSQLTQVHVRDERSKDELVDLDNVHRTPDLAVLAVAERLADTTSLDLSSAASPVVVARQLTMPDGYEQRLVDLGDRLGARWAVQAGGSVSKNDETFYRAIGVQPVGTLSAVLEENPAPVVSVRLHGAVQAILMGIPAIHLAYERKSWGAYADLGLERWLHSARRFDPETVTAQIRELQSDPTPFWLALRERVPALRAASKNLDMSLRRVLTR